MRTLLTLILVIGLLLLISCGSDNNGLNARLYDTEKCEVTYESDHAKMVCPDGTELVIPYGKNGKDGVNGSDGIDAVLLTTNTVADNECKQVLPGIYVENISGGTIYDIYYNKHCSDSKGEYCDNVMAQFGSSGKLGSNKPGSATVCWVGKTMISGVRQSDNSIKLNILTFN